MPTEITAYFAAAATMIAACMTAANLGPRVTGWGFVVFTAGSLAWCADAIASDQHSLLLTNAVLTLVNAVGIWRWLGRIARFDDGAKAAEAKSRRAETPTLVNIGAIEGRGIIDRAGARIGSAVGLMATVDRGCIAYVVAGLGGIAGVGERLVALPWDALEFVDQMLVAGMDAAAIAALPDLDPGDWPAHAKRLSEDTRR